MRASRIHSTISSFSKKRAHFGVYAKMTQRASVIKCHHFGIFSSRTAPADLR